MPETSVMVSKSTSPIGADKSCLVFLPAVLLTVGIAVLSLWENPQIPQTIRLSDKILHGLMYTFLAVAWMLPLIRRVSFFRSGVVVFLSVTLYGGLMEILQHFCTLTRTGEMADLYADALGALLGVLLVGIYAKITNDK